MLSQAGTASIRTCLGGFYQFDFQEQKETLKMGANLAHQEH